ncbi:MAG: dockerin type I domain-containing protein, partial [Planctomycetota bacterium]
TSGGLNWRSHGITTAELITAGVPPTAEMSIRFTANDADPQSINESGVDALRIQDFDCTDPCPADVNGDGTVNVQDFLELIADWGGTGGPADINKDGTVNVEDFLQMLAEWGPC